MEGDFMERDLTQGKIGKSILLFSISMILGNLLQQFYNIVDTYYGIKIEKWFKSKILLLQYFLLAILTRQVYNNLYRMCLLSIIWYDT